MPPRRVRACNSQERKGWKQFRIEYQKTTFNSSDNPYYRYIRVRVCVVYYIQTVEEPPVTRRHVPPSRVIVRLAEKCTGCGKVSYLSRRDAKKERRRFRGSGMNAYPCPDNQNLFHLGHLPPRWSTASSAATRSALSVPCHSLPTQVTSDQPTGE